MKRGQIDLATVLFCFVVIMFLLLAAIGIAAILHYPGERPCAKMGFTCYNTICQSSGRSHVCYDEPQACDGPHESEKPMCFQYADGEP